MRIGKQVGVFALALGASVAFASEASAAWSSESLGGTSVEVYTPATLSPTGDGRALMIVLHGCSQPASAIRDFGNLEGTAEELGVVMAVPAVPNGGVVAGCWDYYGAAHTRNSGHNGAIISIAEGLTADGALQIDPDQVYLAGFSSGGGQAMVTGCLAPDIFSGIAVVAGPGLGSSITQIPNVGVTAEQAASTCQSLAGGNAGELGVQLGISFADANDFVVATGYNQVNAGMFAQVMSEGIGSMASEDVDMAGLRGSEPAGTITVYSDDIGPRVALIDSMSGTTHAWPAGDGMGGGGLSYCSGDGLDFGYYAAEFFASNNVRTGGWDGSGSGSGGETGDSESGGETSGGDPDTGGDTSGGGETGGGGESGESGSASGGDDSASGGGGSGGGDSGDSGGSGGAASAAGDEDYVEPSGLQCSAGGRDGGLLALGLMVLGLWRRRRT